MKMTRRPIRLRIFATHPVQYHVPLWRRLALHPAIHAKVFYFNDQSIRGGLDKGFGINIRWDVDLLGGYQHEFLSRSASLERHGTMRIDQIDSLLREEQADWILISGYTHGFERQLLAHAKRYGSRILMRGEFSDLSYGPRRWPKLAARWAYLRWFYSRVDRFCYIGEGARRHLARHGVARDRMFFSPYSVDEDVVSFQVRQNSRAEARLRLGLNDGLFVFVMSGKLIERKNPFAVLEALERFPDVTRVALLVLGDGELKNSFEARGRRLLAERLVLPGFVNQSQLGWHYLVADALVMTSHYETWGLVVNEAMHHGLPTIVSTQVGCWPDLVEHGQTGYVYRAGDVEGLSRYMLSMVNQPSATRAMGHNARTRVGSYTIDAAARGILHALDVTDQIAES